MAAELIFGSICARGFRIVPERAKAGQKVGPARPDPGPGPRPDGCEILQRFSLKAYVTLCENEQK